MARLTKIEKFYIEGNPDKTPELLAQELKKPAVLIEKYCKELRKKKEVSPPITEDGIPIPKAGDLFVRNARYGVTVMTKQAAELSDEHRKQNARTKKTSDFIRPAKRENS